MSEAATDAGQAAEGATPAGQSLLNGGGEAPPPSAPQSAEPAAPPKEAAEPAKTGDEPSQAETDWRAEFAQGLPEDDRDAFLNEASRQPDKSSFAKRFLDLRRAQSNAITIPAEDDPKRDDKMADIYSKLGRPEAPDKYEFKWDGPEQLSESEMTAVDEFKQVHFRNGGTQKQFDDYVKWESQQRRVQAEAFQAKAEDLSHERMQSLQAQWGKDFDQNKAVYSSTVNHYMGAKDAEVFAGLTLSDGTLVSNHPVIAKALTKVGRERANDDFDFTPMNEARKQDAHARLEAKKRELIEKGIRPSSPNYPRDEMERLAREASATRPRSPHDRFARP